MTWTASMIVALVACLLMYGLALALLVWTVKVDQARLAQLERTPPVEHEPLGPPKPARKLGVSAG